METVSSNKIVDIVKYVQHCLNYQIIKINQYKYFYKSLSCVFFYHWFAQCIPLPLRNPSLYQTSLAFFAVHRIVFPITNDANNGLLFYTCTLYKTTNYH